MPNLHITALTLETQAGARDLIRRVWREHFGDHPDPLVREYMEDERVMDAVSPDHYSAQHGLFLVACERPQGRAAPSPPPAGVEKAGGSPSLFCEAGTVVGCGGVRLMTDGRHEFQRLYVAATHRRLGLAARIMSDCTAFARQQGGHTLCLSSNKALTTSHQFYRQLGFEPTAAWDPEIEPYAYFFQRSI
ncbi:GNAT family N-acetyltransferase [Ideonella sp.]|jgi:GNAT superfamily N-acetyltransferase|uniref:GNAT family N-acetyltransferase n=1 Tax=Ideonella sp. TaxID=1929293 RepID=UPI0037BE889D